MKRRNAEIAKMRRPMKKNKITDGFYGSTVLYLKFVILWVLVILADFILEFRFEFLWPFYLLLRSVYDSFKYQGLAFSIFFVCIALTSDMLCFFFIPVHWLFFAASTYVWVQYVWHTDKGICLPTVILWVLFVYLEAAVRLRDVKHMPGHLDLCRPFAAHCIGYPVVTLGFGFKSYIGYRMRQRKQQHVAKENQFYMQLMQQALPAEAVKPPPPVPQHDPGQQNAHPQNAIEPPQAVAHTTVQNNHKLHNSRQSHEKNGHIPNGTIANGVHTSYSSKSHHRKSVEKCREQHDQQHDHRHTDRQQRSSSHAHQNGSVQSGGGNSGGSGGQQTSTDDCSSTGGSQPSSPVLEQPEGVLLRGSGGGGRSKREKREQDKEREAAEYLQRLESDAKRLRSDLHSSRASEQELRLQVAALTTADKVSKGEISSLQRELEDIQQRLQSALSTKSSDKQTISNLERRIAEERRLRSSLESQLNQERKSRKQEEARAAQAVAAQQREQAAAAAAASQQQRVSGECGSDQCRQRRRELEAELAEARREARWHEERAQQLERDGAAMAERARDADLLMSALSAMQEKNAHLENSLSAENRIKLDLFSALGEAKRQLELRETANRAQEKEIEELKSKIAQVLAVMPNETLGLSTGATSSTISRVRLAESPPSNLDPNATAYTPKGSLVASTEA